MVSRNKEDWLNARIGAALKKRIKDLVDAGKYRNMSEFTIAAVEEKLNPTARDEIIKQELEDLKKRDPAFFRGLFE